ncbi:MAG: sugar transferase [Candidatus Saccharibacteria bacterium]
MKSEQQPCSNGWHDSHEKRELDALLASHFGGIALKLSGAALTMLRPYNYKLFKQSRIGRDGLPFDMYKIQTMDSTTEDLLGEKHILPVARMIRDLAFDELVQICHVSTDPDRPGLMSITGPRPQLPEEICHMRATMTSAGREQQFEQWLNAYHAMRPGLFSLETIVTAGYEPNTLEFYEARASATLWYYENADRAMDLLTFGANLALGNMRYQNMRLTEMVS